MAKGKIDRDVLIKAKKACKTLWEKSVQDNFAIAEGYAYMAVFNKTDFNMWPSLFDNVTSANLQDIAKKFSNVDFKVVLEPIKSKE
jgi:predicted Zn-dependent peptidase